MEPRANTIELETTRINPQPPIVTETPPQEPAAPEAPLSELSPEKLQEMEEGIVAALRSCFDPEVPVNIYELGLIYGVEVSPVGVVHVRMTLTSPACPVAGTLPPEVQAKVKGVPGVTSAKVDVVWDPPWDKDMMSEAAKLELGLFDY